MRSLASNSCGSALISSNSFLIGLKSSPFHNVSSRTHLALRRLNDTVIPLMLLVRCAITSPEGIKGVTGIVAWLVAVIRCQLQRCCSLPTTDDEV